MTAQKNELSWPEIFDSLNQQLLPGGKDSWHFQKPISNTAKTKAIFKHCQRSDQSDKQKLFKSRQSQTCLNKYSVPISEEI